MSSRTRSGSWINNKKNLKKDEAVQHLDMEDGGVLLYGILCYRVTWFLAPGVSEASLQLHLPDGMITCSASQQPSSSNSDRHGTPETVDEKNNKVKQALLLLFDRPFEPVFMPKGPNNTVFVIPDHYWVDRYKHLRTRLEEVYASQRKRGVQIRERFIVKDLGDKARALDDALSASRDAAFMSLIVNREKFAGPITKAFQEASSLEDFLSLAVYCRDRFNPYAFLHILLIVLTNRPDTSGMSVPCLAQVTPELFFDTDTLGRVTEENYVVPAALHIPVAVPLQYVTSSEEDEEQRVAYFREDIGLQMHHKHWHYAYEPLPQYPKDRSGEMFFYVHQQMLSRYNFERLSNDLLRTLPFNNFTEPIKEGYFPKLHCPGAKRHVPGRSPNTVIADVVRKGDNLTLPPIKVLELWKGRILEAVNSRRVLAINGSYLELDEKDGIELLNNVLQSNYLSVNGPYYGSLHNLMHPIMGFAHDPKGLYQEQEAPMGRDFGVAMGDHVFFRWHDFVNSIYLTYKHSLPSYTEDELKFEGVEVKSVEIKTSGSEQKNALFTMWQQNKLDISPGMNFALTGGSTVVLFSHLQHQSFSYNIQVNNLGTPKKGICRIFLAPKFEKGLPLPFKDQKNSFIEMDKFTVDLKNGLNTIERRSQDSAVTIPYETTFGKGDALKTDKSSYGRCGWPHHLLVPKGSAEGFHCQLLVMISDYETDKVEDSITHGTPTLFKRGATMCGQQGKYPDKRPMMYPFDRMPKVDTIDEFLTTNMKVTDVVIHHSSNTVQ